MLVKWIEHTTNPDKKVIYLFDWSYIYIRAEDSPVYIRLDIRTGERVEYSLDNKEVTRFFINEHLIPALIQTKVQIMNKEKLIVKRHQAPPRIQRYADVTCTPNIGLLLKDTAL